MKLTQDEFDALKYLLNVTIEHNKQLLESGDYLKNNPFLDTLKSIVENAPEPNKTIMQNKLIEMQEVAKNKALATVDLIENVLGKLITDRNNIILSSQNIKT